MDREGRETSRDDHEEKDEQAVVGAAALGDRHDREPGDAGLHRHAGADEAVHDRGEHVDEEAGKDAGDETEEGEREHRGQRVGIGLFCALGRDRARAAEEGDAEDLDETGRGQRRGEREQGARRRHQEFQSPGRQLRAEQDRLEGQPFGDEAVERRQRRNGDAADEEGESRLRHAMNEAAEMLHVALAGARPARRRRRRTAGS